MPTDYHPTAMERATPSAPVRHLWQHARPVLDRGSVLDYGCGRGADVAALHCRGFDPWHPDAAIRRPPAGAFDTVLLTYVLNVLPPRSRSDVLHAAATHVRPGGFLAVSVRPEADVQAAGQAWSRYADGYQIAGHFQRGYTGASLSRALHRALGDTFMATDLPPLPGGVMMLLWRADAGSRT